MKKYATASILLNIAAILLFITGIICFSKPDSTPIGSACVCIGFLFLGLGIFFSRKSQSDNDTNEQ